MASDDRTGDEKEGDRESRACVEPAPPAPGAVGPVIVLGSENTGKSTLFHRLTGGRSCVAEIPGGATELPRGTLHRCHRGLGIRARLAAGRGQCAAEGHCCPEVYDTPGTASLFPQGPDEAVARDAVLRLCSGVLLVVADAKNVRRSLALTLHAAEIGLPMVLAINMSDEASRRGIGVDTARLARLLGVDVVATVATEGGGIDELRRCLATPRTPRRALTFPEAITGGLERIEAALEVGHDGLPCSTHGMALQLLGGDEVAAEIVRTRLGDEVLREVRAVVDEVRRGLHRPTAVAITDRIFEVADQLASEVVSRVEPSRGWQRAALDRIGHWAERPVLGAIIATVVVSAMYLWVGVLGATLVVDALDHALFSGLLVPLGDRLVAPIPSAFVRDALMDAEFGALPTGLFLAFGIVLPVLFFFFFAFGVLQSSGYLPRLSVLLDRIFRHVGLNGTGVMPLVMGFSCVTMALITTRMLATKRERIIASFLLLGLPCAPLLAVMLGVLARMPLTATLVVLGVLVAQKVIAGVVAARTLPGPSPDFIMVIPPLRFPRLGHVLVQTIRQTYDFMKEAVPLFLLASFLLFAFDRVGGLAVLERLAWPVTHGLLQLPDEAVQVLIKAIIRRESGAAELTRVRHDFSNLQLVVMLLVLSTIVPCVNAVIVLLKERGLRTSALIVLAVMVYALAVGGAVSHLCTLLGVTFEGS